MKYPEQPIFSESQLTETPFDLFSDWIELAKSHPVIDDWNAMCLSTIGEDGTPDSRMVLLKDWDTKGFCFYTNSLSQKGKQLSHSPVAAVNFFWDALHRQIRIRGDIEELSIEKADLYFATRHPKSQIGAWASAQSQELTSREVFEKRMEDFEKKFAGQVIPRPEYWKGYCLKPKQIEFWQHRDNRLHDRFRYLLVGGMWEVKRLFP